MSAFLGLFEGYGVELEYMIVDTQTLDVRPITDRVLHSIAGSYESEVELGTLSWSNELVLHVIELKTNGPASSLLGLADAFQADVRRINEIVAEHGAVLMPTAMHPWMDPACETRLWPHEFSPVYESFNRIFGCHGHGWSNLQATHLNLPFASDEQFGRLHAAIRLVLPILPALAASSPLIDGRVSGTSDTRLDVYRHNARRIPSVSGRVIPEPVFSEADYAERVFAPMYREIAPHDPDRILQHEWLNARGAIARFDRGTIEIRVLDIQECPRADLAIVQLIVGVIRGLVEQCWCTADQQRAWEIEPLERVFLDCVRSGDAAIISNPQYLRAFGFERDSAAAGELWAHLFDASGEAVEPALRENLRVMLTRGCLATRISRALGAAPARARIAAAYRDLCDCLAQGRMFDG